MEWQNFQGGCPFPAEEGPADLPRGGLQWTAMVCDGERGHHGDSNLAAQMGEVLAE